MHVHRMTLIAAFAFMVSAIAEPAAATIYGCAKNSTGRISKVGTAPPACSPTHTVVSWAQASTGAPSAIIVHGIDVGFPNAALIPVPLAAGEVPAASAYRVPRAATAANMRLLFFRNDVDGDVVVTLYVNGNPTAISTTVAAGSTASVDVAGTVDVSDGDTLSVMLDTTGVTDGDFWFSSSYELQ